VSQVEKITHKKERLGDAYGFWWRRRTWQATKRCGDPLAGADPQVSEWGNPAC